MCVCVIENRAVVQRWERKKKKKKEKQKPHQDIEDKIILRFEFGLRLNLEHVRIFFSFLSSFIYKQIGAHLCANCDSTQTPISYSWGELDFTFAGAATELVLGG